MSYTWYKIINRTEFVNESLTSRELELDLDGKGLVNVRVVLGVGLGLVIDDVYIRANLNSRNPFIFENYVIYQDSNTDIFLGILDEN